MASGLFKPHFGLTGAGGLLKPFFDLSGDVPGVQGLTVVAKNATRMGHPPALTLGNWRESARPSRAAAIYFLERYWTNSVARIPNAALRIDVTIRRIN